MRLFHEAIDLARDHGDELSEARSLNNLGLFFASKAEYQKALEYHRASLALRKKLGDRAGEPGPGQHVHHLHPVEPVRTGTGIL